MTGWRSTSTPAESAALSSVSVQPPPARDRELVALPAGAASLPSKSVALPYPTRSSTPDVAEQLPADAPHESAVALLASATLPPVTARFEVPVASAVGSVAPFVPPEASCTR